MNDLRSSFPALARAKEWLAAHADPVPLHAVRSRKPSKAARS